MFGFLASDLGAKASHSMQTQILGKARLKGLVGGGVSATGTRWVLYIRVHSLQSENSDQPGDTELNP